MFLKFLGHLNYDKNSTYNWTYRSGRFLSGGIFAPKGYEVYGMHRRTSMDVLRRVGRIRDKIHLIM